MTLVFSAGFILLSFLFNLIAYNRLSAMVIAGSGAGAGRNDGLQHNLQSLRQLLLISSVMSVLIAGLVAFFLARILLRPLQRIIHAARNIGTNKMRDPIPVNGTQDELHELSETINEMMQRIDEALQQQQNFFGSASHELKTPLAILRTELEVGLRKQGLEEGVRQLLSNQLEEISRLQAIVNEFLVVSQLRVGSPSIYKKPFDLSVLIVKVYNQLLPLLRQKAIEPVIHFDEEATDFIIHADEDKIRIVLLNLLENAAKYSINDSAVVCKVEKPVTAEEVSVEFINTTKEEKVQTENLQVAFFRSDLVQKGAGLGLWLCNEIIRLHQGRIEVSSGGHRFRVKVNVPVEPGEAARTGVEPGTTMGTEARIVAAMGVGVAGIGAGAERAMGTGVEGSMVGVIPVPERTDRSFPVVVQS